MNATGSARQVPGSSIVGLRELAIRQDDDRWVIGRPATGQFISAPPVAREIISALARGRTPDEITAALRAGSGTTYAVGDFVEALDGLGFLSSVGGVARTEPPPPRQSLEWLKPGHVGWLLHPAVPYAVAAPVIAAAALAVARPGLMPSFHALTWNGHSGLVLAVNVAISWALTGLHELGHLAVGRAAGAPARITLSTRLQFLVVQTDITGLWAAGRRTRVTAYLAGMAVDLLMASAALIAIALAGPHGLARALLSATATLAVLALPFQFMVFTRTDLYFLLQDLTRSTSLHADGGAYLRHLLSRAVRAAKLRAAKPSADPTRGQPRCQRRVIRCYAAVLLAGVSTCLAVEAAFFIPAGVTLAGHAIAEVSSRSLAAIADGATALLVIGFLNALTIITWWRRNLRKGAHSP